MLLSPVARSPTRDPAAKLIGLLQPQPVRGSTPAPPAPGGVAPAEVAVTPAKRKRKKKLQTIQVRRIHRRDLNTVWEFLKLSFRDVNRATVEYQRPRSKQRFLEIYEEEGVEQLLFTVEREIVAYTECTFEVLGRDTWINPSYFENRDMRPLYVEELAVHPDWHSRGVGSFVLEQLQHLARVRGLTHLVLEVAENNENALQWYRKRGFRKLDAAIFMAQSVVTEPELLPPRELPPARTSDGEIEEAGDEADAEDEEDDDEAAEDA
jgi:ribosomal protein S18 acetylase RimI-like enzyme